MNELDTAVPATAVQPSERIDSLDILRGIALLGMFFVHFRGHSIAASTGFAHGYQRFGQLFLNDRFAGMFGILFGAGFAVQMSRAESTAAVARWSMLRRVLGVLAFVLAAEAFMRYATGGRFWIMFAILFATGTVVPWRDPFLRRFSRRMAALALFGVITEVFFGYWVLFEYAIGAIPLVFVRRWSNRALVALLVISVMSGGIRATARMTYFTAIGHPERFKAELDSSAARKQAAWQALRESGGSPKYRTVVAGRARQMEGHYTGEGGFTPVVMGIPLFLIGLLAFRLGVFQDPRRNHGLIIGCMIFGVVSWAASEWLFPIPVQMPAHLWPPLKVAVTLATRFWFFGLIVDQWLSVTYIGAVLLLVAYKPVWLRRLSAFGITGRMALTNYVLQVIVLDFTFSHYALDLKLSAAYAPLAALGLFIVDVALSRWWLSRYHFGPLEWLWRSITYARWQPMRRITVAGNATMVEQLVG